MEKIVAAKILLTGITNSALRRDNKSLNEIILGCRTYAKSCDVSISELKEVAQMKITDLIQIVEPTKSNES